MCDQMRAPRWLPQGVSDVSTFYQTYLPNIYKYIYSVGTSLNNHYGAATNCTPSRSCMQTGLCTQQTYMFVTDDLPSSTTKPYGPSLQPYYQSVNGGPATPGQGFATIADVLTQNTSSLPLNYDCVWIGKWHLSDNPQESGSGNPAYSCSPGGNGPSDYGYTDPAGPYNIPTPPGGAPAFSNAAYPSPNGVCVQGNSGDFLGDGNSPPSLGDTPEYLGNCPSGCTFSPNSSIGPPGYNQLNDAAIADAFGMWLGSNPSQPWFAGVSFINPHDMTQFPWSFNLSPGNCTGIATPPTYFCDPSPGALDTNGFQTPPTVTTMGGQTFYGELRSTESIKILPIPPAYTAASPPQDWYGAGWNYYDDVSNANPGSSTPGTPNSPYTAPTPTTPGSGKPNLQAFFQTSNNNLFGQVIEYDTPTGTPPPPPPDQGNEPRGWYKFLNYYLWMMRSLDEQVGAVVTAVQTAVQNNGQNPPVIIFTADHGDYGGSHNLHAKGGALFDEAINIPLIISMPNQSRQMNRSFVCSNVDILPFIYTLAIGNESWRCYRNDIVNYLAGRESIMDAILLGTSGSTQRRQSPFPNTNPYYCNPNQPYVLHTNDEYYYVTPINTTPYTPPHAVAFRTVDNTINGLSETPTTPGGGKLGVYSFWAPGTTTPDPNESQQFEFYNYEPGVPFNPGASVDINFAETGNALNLWTLFNAGVTCSQGSYFTLQVSLPSVSVTQGSFTSVTLYTKGINFSTMIGFATGTLPSGVTVAYSPTSVNPGSSSTLTITASATAPTGTYVITVTATAGSAPAQVAMFSLTITT